MGRLPLFFAAARRACQDLTSAAWPPSSSTHHCSNPSSSSTAAPTSPRKDKGWGTFQEAKRLVKGKPSEADKHGAGSRRWAARLPALALALGPDPAPSVRPHSEEEVGGIWGQG